MLSTKLCVPRRLCGEKDPHKEEIYGYGINPDCNARRCVTGWQWSFKTIGL